MTATTLRTWRKSRALPQRQAAAKHGRELISENGTMTPDIDMRAECCYITIGSDVIYIDWSMPGELIIDRWIKGEEQ